NLGEAAMAVGTCASFAVQAIIMLIMLERRIGNLGLSAIAIKAGKMMVASLLMYGVCLAVRRLPFYPDVVGKTASAVQLAMLMGTGIAVYFAACAAMGMNVLKQGHRLLRHETPLGHVPAAIVPVPVRAK